MSIRAALLLALGLCLALARPCQSRALGTVPLENRFLAFRQRLDRLCRSARLLRASASFSEGRHQIQVVESYSEGKTLSAFCGGAAAFLATGARRPLDSQRHT